MENCFRKITADDDVYSIQEWIDYVKDGCFIDYDGFGEFATETDVNQSKAVCPSSVKNGKLEQPEWATHIVWYNR